MIKAIIVDDEPPARREMRRLLDEYAEISVVGTAGTLDLARGLLLRTRPDVVFLDIKLGRQSGFALLSDIDAETAVVFVTAYDRHAVRAFEAGAIDYLTKPVDAARLRATVARVRERGGARGCAPPALFTAAHWVFLDGDERQEFIDIADVTHIEAVGGRTRVFTQDGRTRMTGRALSEWEERLAGGDFARVHRSAIVNLKHVASVERWFQYSYRVTMRGCTEPVIMSRRHASRLRGLIG